MVEDAVLERKGGLTDVGAVDEAEEVEEGDDGHDRKIRLQSQAPLRGAVKMLAIPSRPLACV